MPRSVNAVASRARRKKVLKLAKGNFGSRGNVWTVAKNTVEKGLTYAYRDRKNKKRQFRSLWIQRINANKFDPEYVLILSGDHIYKMDYADMLSCHKANNADCTIAVLPVPMKEASRFGIMNTDDEGRIVEFEEKPEHPKSNLASMGIYIFNWKQLRKELISDMTAEGSHHDFGKDIIPNFLNANKRLYAYKFEGYWKDVGTIDSLWEANMDLLNKNNELNLDDPNWKIYTEDIPTLPHYVGPTGKVEHCYINQGAIIRGEAVDSVLFNNVEIDEDAYVSQAVLMPNVKVGKGAKIYRAIVADGVKIDDGAVVGSPDSDEIELISKRVKKGE